MSDEKKAKTSEEKEPVNPWNWVLGSEFVLAIVVLLLSAAGYIVLK